MAPKKRILLKITGEIFLSHPDKKLTPDLARHVIAQIKELANSHQFGIVIGGGNFFRGRDQGTTLGMTASVGHQAGMLATMLNGLILKDLLEQQNLSTELLCAIACPEVGGSISHQAILSALHKDQTIVFTGGTGNPFFTNDTNAVIRGLQINADEIWKATSVDGIYSADPRQDSTARLIKKLSYKEAIDNKLGIMDSTAYTLAEQYKQTIRVFNIFEKNSLIEAARNENFGSIIHS